MPLEWLGGTSPDSSHPGRDPADQNCDDENEENYEASSKMRTNMTYHLGRHPGDQNCEDENKDNYEVSSKMRTNMRYHPRRDPGDQNYGGLIQGN